MVVTPVNIRTGASIAAATPTQNNPAQVTRANIIGGARTVALTNVEQPAGNISRFTFPTDIGPHYMNIGISRSSRTSLQNSAFQFLNKNSVEETETNIILPLPENIRDVTQTAFSEGPVLGGANALQAIIGGVSGGASGYLGNIAGRAMRQGGGLGAFAGALTGFAGPLAQPAMNELSARTGLTPNQMLTVLLQGPTYKTHSFTWKLYPKTPQESKIIKNIIQEIKSKSRPGTSFYRQFFTFPRLFNLSFAVNGKKFFDENDPNNYLFSFKPAVLEGISVNYTPSGQPALYKGTGAPDGVEITMNFKEVEYWLAEAVSFSDRLFGYESGPVTPSEGAAAATGTGTETTTDGGQSFGPGGLSGA